MSRQAPAVEEPAAGGHPATTGRDFIVLTDGRFAPYGMIERGAADGPFSRGGAAPPPASRLCWSPMHHVIRLVVRVGVLLSAALPLRAQNTDSIAAYTAAQCPSCAEWNAAAKPVRLFGNAYYVGTRGLSAILLTSPQGHVLLDAGLPESAPLIAANVRALGFRVEDIELIVNSHSHYDHAGGIASLQRWSGASVAASPASAPVLRTGIAGRDDPQYGPRMLPHPGASNVRVIADGDTLRVGPIEIVAHFTPGHTRGGTSWSWRSCDAGECVTFVYADSQTPVSDDNFLFTRNTAYPTVLSDFERGFAVLERLTCDVLVTPHPGASRLWERLDARDRGDPAALRDRDACRKYAANARQALARRVAQESSSR